MPTVNQLNDDQLRQCPFFGAFDDMSICTTNLIEILPQKNLLLADTIPAESYAAGRNQIPNKNQCKLRKYRLST